MNEVILTLSCPVALELFNDVVERANEFSRCTLQLSAIARDGRSGPAKRADFEACRGEVPPISKRLGNQHAHPGTPPRYARVRSSEEVKAGCMKCCGPNVADADSAPLRRRIADCKAEATCVTAD